MITTEQPRYFVSCTDAVRAEQAADTLAASGALAIVSGDVRAAFAEGAGDEAEAEVLAEIHRAEAVVYLGAADALDEILAYAVGRPVLPLSAVFDEPPA